MKQEIEKCICKSGFPIVLQYHSTDNAIVCSNCNLDRELVISDKLNREIVEWIQNYKKIYQHWLESDIATDELTNPSSTLNELGLQITKQLNTIVSAYYWLHVDEGVLFKNCPKCSEGLKIVKNKYSDNHKVCDNCRILINE